MSDLYTLRDIAGVAIEEVLVENNVQELVDTKTFELLRHAMIASWLLGHGYALEQANGQ